MFLIIADVYSKWLDVHPMNTMTTIVKLCRTFAEHGLPDQYVTDNATCFINSDFEEFMTNNDIKHITSASYHLAKNGQAERAVKSFKDSLKKIKEEDIETQRCKILLQYRITSYTAELPMKRKLTTRLRIYPDLQLHKYEKQIVAKGKHDQHEKQVEFMKGDLVFAGIFNSRRKWIQEVLDKKSGSVSVCREEENLVFWFGAQFISTLNFNQSG